MNHLFIYKFWGGRRKEVEFFFWKCYRHELSFSNEIIYPRTILLRGFPIIYILAVSDLGKNNQGFLNWIEL